MKHRMQCIESLQQRSEPQAPTKADGLGGTIEKARAIAYLAGVARKAIETGTLATRLEMLERVLKQRKGDHPR